jgi:hypothetical protein
MLQLSADALSKVIEIPENAVSEASITDALLKSGGKSQKRAEQIILLYGSLSSVFSGDDSKAARWLREKNSVLGGAPVDLIQTSEGLGVVLNYLTVRSQLA